jgi:hypothetical protein
VPRSTASTSSSCRCTRGRRFANFPKELDPDEGELTRSRKLRREFLEQRYRALIEGCTTGPAPVQLDIPVTYQDGRKAHFAAARWPARRAAVRPCVAPQSGVATSQLTEERAMIDFLNYLINGALIGLLYALIAMGFVVIYRASKVFNFAQGELVVFGGYMVWWTGDPAGLPLWIGCPLAFSAPRCSGC